MVTLARPWQIMGVGLVNGAPYSKYDVWLLMCPPSYLYVMHSEPHLFHN